MKTCYVCGKRMRGDHLVRHMKTHKKKPNSIYQVKEYQSKIDVVALKNEIVNEYHRKLDLGRKVKQIVHERNAPTASLDKCDMEALELFENRGQVKEIEAAEWRPWQRQMLEYLHIPTQRTIIWVVGEKGNEGKTFFQKQIEQEYGEHRVFLSQLIHSTRDTLRIMKIYVYIETDIFLFNIPRSMHLSSEHYELFESIKDGCVTSVKYNIKNMRFNTPNVLMVFSTREPDCDMFSHDRWIILEISEDLTGLTEITDDVNKNKKMV